mgnify:CR=1 FL=1
MGKREDYEQERENALWRVSIRRMFQSGDLEGLIDLKEGPDSLDDEILELLNECIKELDEKTKERSQAD